MGVNMLSVSAFRKQLSTEFLTTLQGKPLTLLAHSKPVAVVVDYETYEAIQAELARLKEKRFQELAAALREIIKTHQNGDTSGMKTLEDFVADLGLEQSS